MTDYVLFSYYYLPVLTKEYATGEELKEHFGCIPDGVFDDRMARAIRITKDNRKKMTEGKIKVIEIFPEFDTKYAKTLKIEEVYRSW